MSNIFLSHRKVDAAAAERLAQEIQAAGHDIWFDEWRIDVGDSIVSRIDEGLAGASYLILCYSSSGLSPWVNREWQSALARQLSHRGIKVLPVLQTGGSPPEILADIAYADLTADWHSGVGRLLQAIR
jgi:hypothetical protein